MPPDIAVIAAPCFDLRRERVELTVAAGASIADIVRTALPGVTGPLLDRLRVTIDGQVYLPAYWSKVRPKPGTVVLVRAVPGDSDVLRNVLIVAITVAAVAAGQFYGPLLAGSLLGLPGAATAGTLPSLLSAGITGTAIFTGTLLVNALIPPRTDPKDKPIYSIQGPRNNATPDGVVPMLLGRMRIFPPYGMLPHTEAVGIDRFATAMFVLSYGPIAISEPRIGDTLLERYGHVQIETRQGYPGDARLSLTPTTVIEKPLAIGLLTSAVSIGGGPQTRTTASNATRYSIDITFPGGLFALNEDGERETWTVEFTHRYRAAGASTWTDAPPIVITAKDSRPVVRTIAQIVPAIGRYEVEVTRLTIDWDEADQSKRDRQVTSRSSWTAIRSFRPEYPIAFEHPLALAALRIQASRQLNGVPDEVNFVACTICPDWDAATQTWITRQTNNPASLFRHVLTCTANAYRVDEADIAALGAWHEHCVANGLTYNRYIDFEISLGDVLSEVAGAGRASPHHSGEKWDVVIDRVIEQVTAHVTPRNSWGFEGEHRFEDLPDALVINFQDETNLWDKAQRMVRRPGLVGEPRRVEKFDMPGVTNPTMIYREGTRRYYELMRRPNTYWAMQGPENFGTQRGDRAELSHDVIDRTLVSARVQALLPPEGEPKAVLLDDSITMEEGKSYAVRFRRDDGMSLLRSLKTVPGTDRMIVLDGVGDAPQIGNLAMVGLALRTTRSCTVKGVEAMAKMQARLTLIDRAPEIDSLVDATPVPAWSGLAGGVAQEPTGPPLAPIITSVVSGRLAQGVATVANPNPVAVLLQADPADVILLAAFEVRHRLQGAGAWSASVSAAVAAGSVSLAGYARADAIEVQARAVSLQGTSSPWSATVTHVVAATDPPPPAMPIYLSATQSAPHVVDHLFRAPDDASVRHLQLVGARGYGAPIAQASIVAQIASGQNQAGSYTSAAGIGLYRYWLKALNSAAIASDPAPSAGPREILAPRQLGSLLTAPDDMTNAAWVKLNVTPTLSGTGPDGVTMSLLREVVTAGNVVHRVGQAVTFPAGTSSLRICYAQGVAAAGRTRGALYVFDAAGTSSTRVTFNLAAGTVGAVSYTGSTVTSAIAEITRVSADLYLVTLTATVAAGGASGWLYTVRDTNTMNYIGDSSMGLYAWAASLAPAA